MLFALPRQLRERIWARARYAHSRDCLRPLLEHRPNPLVTWYEPVAYRSVPQRLVPGGHRVTLAPRPDKVMDIVWDHEEGAMSAGVHVWMQTGEGSDAFGSPMFRGDGVCFSSSGLFCEQIWSWEKVFGILSFHTVTFYDVSFTPIRTCTTGRQRSLTHQTTVLSTMWPKGPGPIDKIGQGTVNRTLNCGA